MAGEAGAPDHLRSADDAPSGAGEAGETGARYLSVAQVARRLDCSVSLVQKWRRLGWIPATRLGPKEVPVYGYLPEDVERFASERWNRRRGRPPGSGKKRTAAAAAGGATAADSDPGARSGPTHWSAPTPLPLPALPETGRPVVIWDADPRAGTAIVLARFGARELQTALDTAGSWSRRYPDLAVGALIPPSTAPHVIAAWRGGQRIPDQEEEAP